MSSDRERYAGGQAPCRFVGSGELWESLKTLPTEELQPFIDCFFEITLRVGFPEVRRGYRLRRLSSAERNFLNALLKVS